MSGKPGFDPDVLGRILLLQTALQATPDEAHVAEVVAHGLEDLPAVTGCAVRIGDHERRTGSLGTGRGARGDGDGAKTGGPDAASPRRATREYAIATQATVHGEILLELTEATAFQPYAPLVANTANLVALHVENARHARSLQDANRRLETEVAERTSDLRDSMERYRSLLENTTEGFYLFEPPSPIPIDAPVDEQVDRVLQGRIVECNDALARMYGRARAEEISGLTVADLHVGANRPGKLAFIRTFIEQGYRIGDVLSSEVDREGRPAWFSNTVTGIVKDGHLVRAWGAQTDVTERKRAEADREHLQTQLNQAQKVEAIGRLAGGVAHDLNNLLSPILGYGEMLLDDLGLRDARRESVVAIIRAGERARDLVRQLLAFSRKQTLEFRPLDLGRTVTEFESLLQRTIPEDIEVRVVSPERLPPISGDAGQLEQVILNLAVNAADAMPNGGRLTLETAAVDLDQAYAAAHPGVKPGAYVMLAVSDTGHGLDAETREHIFEPFYSTKGEQGTGLGLSVVYGIVKQHGGNIWAYSEPGHGTTFKVYLPVSAEPWVQRRVEAERPTAESLRGAGTILLAEDDDQVRELARAVLERHGYTVLPAPSSEEALAILERRQEPVDLLLTDVVMPGMNGRELYRRAVTRMPGLKVLYMSGYTDDIIAQRGVIDGGAPFVQKPFSVQALVLRVREELQTD